MPTDLHFLRPDWFWLLPLLALLLWRLARNGGGSDAWRGLVDPHLLPRLLSDDGSRTRRLPLVLLGLGWLLGVLALAGPVWQRLPQPVYQARQYRVLALDLSPGMNANDLAPSRLAHARFEVLDLLRKVKDGQTALVAYGAEPYVVSPLTSDTDTIAAQVPSLATDLLPVQGARRTDLALDKAGDLLRQAGAPDGEVILVTDGLDHPGAADEAVRRLRAAGYTVSVLGVGTAKGAPVPLAGGGFLKDATGAIRLSRLDTGALRSLAHLGGGRYVTAGPDDRDIETLVPDTQAGLTRQAERQDTRADQWREEGPWLLLLLLPLAALAFRRGWLAPLVLVACIVPPPQAHAFGWDDLWLRPDQQAQRLMQAGEHQQAAETFRRPDWRAAAQYRAGDYQQALESLGDTPGSRADYNRGNALARLGRLQEALDAYDHALSQDPGDADASHNRELVKKLLDQKQQQQQQQGQQGRQQQQQQGQQGQQGQEGQEGQQSQQGQGGREDQQSQAGEQGRENQPQGGQGQNDQQGGQGQHDQQDRRGQEDRKGDAGQQGEQERKDPQARQGEEGKEEQEEQQGQQDRQGEQGEKDGQAQVAQQQRDEAGKQSQSKVSSPSDSEMPHSSKAPGAEDLLSDAPPMGARAAESGLPEDPEQRQAMEQMLRQVEDDPAGLLRQRFLLQHLRRSGQLP